MKDSKNTIKVEEIHETVDTLRFEQGGDFVNAEKGGDYHSECYTRILDTKYLFGVEYVIDYKKYCELIDNDNPNPIEGLYMHRLDIRSNTEHEKTRNDVLKTQPCNSGYYETDEGVGGLFFTARISVDVYNGDYVYISLNTDGIIEKESEKFKNEVNYKAQAVYEDFVFYLQETYNGHVQEFLRRLTECIVIPVRESLETDLDYEIRKLRELTEKIDNLSNALRESKESK